MADDTDTPTGDAPAAATPRRRAAPRKPSIHASAATTGAKPTARKAKTTATRTATTARDKVAGEEGRVTRAVKPRSTNRGAARATGRKASGGDDANTTTTRAADGRRTAAKSGGGARNRGKSTLDRATDAVGGRTVAAALGAIAAAGATVAAVLTLRGSSGRNVGTTKKPIDISGTGDKEKMHGQTVHTDGSHQPGAATSGGKAHQPDGTDSSASFRAGIADENTVPEKV